MATLYSQSTQNNFSNFNDGTVANRNYAWSFVASATGTPTNIKIYAESVTGTPTGEIYISADKTFAAADYGQATGLTFTTGENSIALSSGAQITSGNTYWVYVRFTSDSSNFATLQYDTTKNNYHTWRPTASNIDPDNDWFTNDMKMVIDGTLASGPALVKTFNGLATASVKTVNGLAIASVKTKNGLA